MNNNKNTSPIETAATAINPAASMAGAAAFADAEAREIINLLGDDTEGGGCCGGGCCGV